MLEVVACSPGGTSPTCRCIPGFPTAHLSLCEFVSVSTEISNMSISWCLNVSSNVLSEMLIEKLLMLEIHEFPGVTCSPTWTSPIRETWILGILGIPSALANPLRWRPLSEKLNFWNFENFDFFSKFLIFLKIFEILWLVTLPLSTRFLVGVATPPKIRYFFWKDHEILRKSYVLYPKIRSGIGNPKKCLFFGEKSYLSSILSPPM